MPTIASQYGATHKRDIFYSKNKCHAFKISHHWALPDQQRPRSLAEKQTLSTTQSKHASNWQIVSLTVIYSYFQNYHKNIYRPINGLFNLYKKKLDCKWRQDTVIQSYAVTLRCTDDGMASLQLTQLLWDTCWHLQAITWPASRTWKRDYGKSSFFLALTLCPSLVIVLHLLARVRGLRMHIVSTYFMTETQFPTWRGKVRT